MEGLKNIGAKIEEIQRSTADKIWDLSQIQIWDNVGDMVRRDAVVLGRQIKQLSKKLWRG